MKFLVTGHRGFIGTNLCEFLQRKSQQVVGIDYPTDLCSKTPDIDVDVVVHLAAETDVRKSIEFPEITFGRNSLSTSSALNIARRNNAKFIFTSSCSTYNVSNPYAASKLACEALCTAFRKSYDMDISVLRISNVYGPHSINKTSVISKFIKEIIDGKTLEIYGSGDQTRDFIYVNDVCKAIYDVRNDINIDLDVSSGEHVSINYVYSIISSIARSKGFEVNFTNTDPIKGELTNPYKSIGLRRVLNLQIGLERTFDWFLKNYPVN